MKTTISSLALLAATAFAAPAPLAAATTSSAPAPTATASAFGLMSLRSGSDIHFATINARDSKFWIGKQTNTYCPPGDGIPCESLSNTTTLRLNGDNLVMDTAVPGGQVVYIGPKGALRFTEAHTNAMPAGSTTGGFNVTQEGSFGEISHAGGFVACPTKKAGGAPYEIFVQVKGFEKTDCEGFDFVAVNVTTGPAWEYI